MENLAEVIVTKGQKSPDPKPTQARMFELVEAQMRAGLTQTEFCKRRGLSRNVFQYWLRKYRDVNGKGKIRSSGFVSLKLAEPEAMRVSITKGKLRIEFQGSVSAGYLSELIRGIS